MTPSPSPSQSPTSYPISRDAYDSELVAMFNITGWTASELSLVADDIPAFASDLTFYIYQGFDNDEYIEYQNVGVNMSTINDCTVDQLLDGNLGLVWNSLYGGMELQYIIKCSRSYCDYITGDFVLIFNRSAFEEFVSDKLNIHFFATDSSAGSLVFTVENFFDADAVVEDEDESSCDDSMIPSSSGDITIDQIGLIIIIVSAILLNIICIAGVFHCISQMKKRRQMRVPITRGKGGQEEKKNHDALSNGRNSSQSTRAFTTTTIDSDSNSDMNLKQIHAFRNEDDEKTIELVSAGYRVQVDCGHSIDDFESCPSAQILKEFLTRLVRLNIANAALMDNSDIVKSLECLVEHHYSVTKLLDDFNHLKYEHNVDQDDELFDAAYEFFKDSDTEIVCDIDECTYFSRHSMDRGHPDVDYNVEDNDHVHLLLDTMATIHSYFLHAFDTQRFSKEERQRVMKMEGTKSWTEISAAIRHETDGNIGDEAMSLMTSLLTEKRKRARRRRRYHDNEHEFKEGTSITKFKIGLLLNDMYKYCTVQYQ